MQAAIDGVKQVWTAVLTSTLTTVLVFLPILFIQQEAGQLYSDVAIAISSAIVASMILSVTLVPLLAAQLPPPLKKQNMDWADAITSRAEKVYKHRGRSLTTVGITTVVVVGIWWWLMPPAEYEGWQGFD